MVLLNRSPGIKRGIPGGYGVNKTLLIRPSNSSMVHDQFHDALF